MPGLHDTRSAPHVIGPYNGASKYTTGNGYSSGHQQHFQPQHSSSSGHHSSRSSAIGGDRTTGGAQSGGGGGFYYASSQTGGGANGHLRHGQRKGTSSSVIDVSSSSGDRGRAWGGGGRQRQQHQVPQQYQQRSQSIGRSPPSRHRSQQQMAPPPSQPILMQQHAMPPVGGRPTAFQSAATASQLGGRSVAGGRVEEETPSYWVEHLATFAVGKQYGLEWPEDGIRKLKQMEKNSAIWAQPMVLRLRPAVVSVEDENGELVEQFPMELVADPTAHLSTDPRDIYNNILLFVVREDRRNAADAGGRAVVAATPTEMHIFQCNRVSANEVVDDFRAYIGGHFSRVKTGRRDTGFMIGQSNTSMPAMLNGDSGGGSYTRTESREIRAAPGGSSSAAIAYPTPEPPTMVNGGGARSGGGAAYFLRDDVSATSDTSENFERDVNTLNRCFDDIERFVARIQSAAIAQREIEAQQFRQRRAGGRTTALPQRDTGILALRAQLPNEMQFVDILQKFKLSFNLLAKLKNHIHEPNAPELLHFLFTPLAVILDACQWGFGRNIAPQVQSPLLARETKELMRNCLTSKESDVWLSLGDAWQIPPEDWPGSLPPPYRPVFGDGFAPYGAPARGQPQQQQAYRAASSDQLMPVRRSSTLPVNHANESAMIAADDLSRMTLERDRMRERERRLMDEERKVEDERVRLAEERRQFYEEQERRSVISERPAAAYYTDAGHRRQHLDAAPYNRESAQSSPAPQHRSMQNLAVSPSPLSGGAGVGQTSPSSAADSPRQRAFLDELARRGAGAKVAQVSYDRVGQNPKELTVTRGEYLEVVNDSRNWWECRNVHGRLGYVPHTIMQLVYTASNASPANAATVHQSGGQGAGGDASVILVNGGGSSNRQQQQQQLPSSSVSPRQPAPEWSAESRRAEPPAPPAGPLPDLTSQLSAVQLRNTTVTTVQQHHSQSEHDQLRVLQRQKTHPELLRDELQATIGRNGSSSEALLGKRSPTGGGGGPGGLVIDEHSSESHIGEWLQSKGFSIRTMHVLEGQTGATLFALTKRQLQDFCGKDEGQRLYSQLLVQKNITGFGTKSAAELSAILDIRKRKSEAQKLRANSNAIMASQPVANGSAEGATTVANYSNSASPHDDHQHTSNSGPLSSRPNGKVAASYS